MDLSIIIVSYNVRAFLEKCLISVYKALDGIEAEVFVVDNDSIDNTVSVIRSRYPSVKLIANRENVGFARANNMAIRQATGRYILLLNPDTVVSEDTFARCISFMDRNPDAGSVGVKMYDGTGTYLPESKRGLPSPLSSFFKITGINILFPKSGFFNGYYMGGLDPDQTHKVEVLTGAFMFMRASALEKVGLLDESFFMYGEDIDLSYRFLKAGYSNYYLPSTSIIHYKGESTRRSSMAYVKVFYQAMLIFVRKHYPGTKGIFLRSFLNAGIFAKAIVSGIRRLLGIIVIPVVDLILIVTSVLLVTRFWSQLYFNNSGHFDENFYRINLPLYSGTWFVSQFLFAGNRPGRGGKNTALAVVVGTLVILMIYSLLDISLRSSRAVILLSAPVVMIALLLWNSIIDFILSGRRKAVIGIVGSDMEAQHIMELINRVNPAASIAGVVSFEGASALPEHIGDSSQLGVIVEQYNISELIFAHKDISFSEINRWMSVLGPGVHYKIAGKESQELIGSHSKHVSGGFYTAEVKFSISGPVQRRNKRMFDILVAIGIIMCTPLLVLFRHLRPAPGNAWKVLTGKNTWVSYDRRDNRTDELPVLKPGVWPVTRGSNAIEQSETELHMLNYLYAREYSVWRDIEKLISTEVK